MLAEGGGLHGLPTGCAVEQSLAEFRSSRPIWVMRVTGWMPRLMAAWRREG